MIKRKLLFRVTVNLEGVLKAWRMKKDVGGASKEREDGNRQELIIMGEERAERTLWGVCEETEENSKPRMDDPQRLCGIYSHPLTRKTDIKMTR